MTEFGAAASSFPFSSPSTYDVDPSDIRHQKGSFKFALDRHERDRLEKSAKRWRLALTEAANVSGRHFELELSYEYEIIQEISEEVSKMIGSLAQFSVGLDHQVKEVCSVLNKQSHLDGATMVGICGIGETVPKLLINPSLWKFVGFGSSIVGFSCYGLSSSFHDLFGKFNRHKIIIYCAVSMSVSCLMLFVNKCRGFAKSFLVKAQVGFLILTLTSLYSFWEDRASEQGNEKKGHGRIFNLSSSGAFALMSLSLSRQLQLGFEMGMFNFFLGCFMVTLMKISLKLVPVAAVFCFVLMNIRSCSDYLLEMRGGGGESAETESADIENNLLEMRGGGGESAETESADIESNLRNYVPFEIRRRHLPPKLGLLKRKLAYLITNRWQ